jgi:hypothetical protein
VANVGAQPERGLRSTLEARPRALAPHLIGDADQLRAFSASRAFAYGPPVVLRIKRIELHADFLSGYFAGRRRKERPNFPASVVTATIGGLGDDLRSSPNHHGTPGERKAAVVQGFKAAFEQNQNFAEAVRVGMEWVTRV